VTGILLHPHTHLINVNFNTVGQDYFHKVFSFRRSNVSEPRLMSQVRTVRESRVRVDQCVSAHRAIEVPVLVWLCSSCNRETQVGGP
jgi:hypothetical protein